MCSSLFKGKSLSLICSALTWLHMHNEVQQSRLESELKKAEAAVQQCEAADDWFAAAGDRQAQTEAIHAVKEKLSRLNMERARVEAIRLRKLKAVKEGDASAFSRGVKSCTNKASCAPQETGQTEQCKENLPPTDDHALLDEELDLLLPDDPEAEADEARVDNEEEGCLKIYYCSRTHSQLSQFVGELQRTKFGGERTRVVALASRHNLCINPDVARLKLPSLVNDRCLELQRGSSGRPTVTSSEATKAHKRSKTSQPCPFNKLQAVRALGDELLTRVQDLEEALTQGKATKACPYYAARTAVRDAQVGGALKVKGTTSSTFDQVCSSRQLLQQYMERYESRLSARNLLHVNQILFCLKAFAAALDPSLRSVKSISEAVPSDKLMTVPHFLSLCRLDNINLTALVHYLDNSKLANKLQGFVRLFEGRVTISRRTPSTPASSSSSCSLKNSSTASFLSKLSSDSKKMPSKKSENHSMADEDAAVVLPSASTDSASATTGNPFLQTVELLRRLLTSHSSGRVLVSRDDPLRPTLKYLVLDPASYFHDVVRQCRSVILVGGTMKPMKEFREQLYLGAGAPANRVLEHSCGHVVAPDCVLPIALTAGPTGLALDLTHGKRDSLHMVEEVGRVLYNLSCVVPAGIVVFLPSYHHSQLFLSMLRTRGFLAKIAAKKKVRQCCRGR
ncbi:DEAD2 [Trinorchestia longiramus]|nr:DEAD2 [Trinorchestia longiramus]